MNKRDLLRLQKLMLKNKQRSQPWTLVKQLITSEKMTAKKLRKMPKIRLKKTLLKNKRRKLKKLRNRLNKLKKMLKRLFWLKKKNLKNKLLKTNK